MEILAVAGRFFEWLQVFWSGSAMIVAFSLTGILLSVRTSFVQLRHFPAVMKESLQGIFCADGGAGGDISPFQALTTALAGTIGTGNIAGVATAITLGGPGAVFWMWVSAFLGMATKYAEIVLAVYFRRASGGTFAGGPMYFLESGLKSPSLAVLFATFGAVAAFGIGNLVQANSVASVLQEACGMPPLATGLCIAFVAALIVLGGIRRLAAVTEKMVPLMSAFYLCSALVIIVLNAERIPEVISRIMKSAFSGQAACGGFAGAGVASALRFGFARSIFSNEAGLGSASIAHAAAKTDHPVRQGLWGICEVFIDTHVICTMTALVILLTGAWTSGLEGAAMTSAAFSGSLPFIGGWVVAGGLVFFALSSLFTWSYYGEKCFEYLANSKFIHCYRLLWVLLIPFGAAGSLRTVWGLSDTLNGLMAIPNLFGLWGLSGLVASLTREYFGRRR